MIFQKMKLDNAYIIDLEKIEDHRGYFSRAWCKKEFQQWGLNANIVQTNLSSNKRKGTLRGLHYQVAPYSEAKTIRCLKGRIYHVIVDLRPDSLTYLKWQGIELTAENKRMLYMPGGFAHGYQTLEDDSESIYSVSEYYSPDSARGIRWNDPLFGIKWPISDNVTLSEQDRNWPDFKI